MSTASQRYLTDLIGRLDGLRTALAAPMAEAADLLVECLRALDEARR